MQRFQWRRLLALLLLLAVPTAEGTGAGAQNGPIRLTLKNAAAATELPVGPWGAYSGRHAGPCYQASRRLAPLFAFPIVVAQQHEDLLPIGSRGANGKVRLRPERVTRLRRAGGLAPIENGGDAPAPLPVSRIIDADGDGILTTARALFPKSAPAGTESGPAADRWPAGEARISWSPVFADNGAEGLLVQVTLTNPEHETQEYCVDMFGGLERPDPLFAQKDLKVAVDPDGRGVTLRHAKSDAVFALAFEAGDFASHAFAVTEAALSAEAAAAPRGPGGVAPAGDGAADPIWGLTRLSGISVEPGSSRTVFLCVGLGKDDEGALVSARTLLSLVQDRAAGAAAQKQGLLALTAQAHAKAAYPTDDAAMRRLMAQSLINIPFHDVRRIGVPSREGGAVYRPGLGGWMGLGWSGYRPDWSAAQLNGWFLTGTPPQKAINHPMSVPPIDILALWELTQRTHDTDMLARFYPYAVWRFREFLESGREREDDWLFTWPPRKERADVQANRAEGRRKAEMCGMAASDSMADYAPDYSAYVLLSARLLLASAKRLDRGAEEQASFTSVMRSASAAMTKSLWSADLGLFMPRPVSNVDAIALRDPAAQGASPGIECLLPLMGGAECLTPEQDAALIKHLLDPADFWSASGVRSLSLKSPAYRPEDPDMGGIRFGIQWLFWKALLDRGDSEHAEELATRVLAAYSGASAKSDGCPEWLGAESGRAGGRLDSAGEACALLAISEAYHRAGTVSCGWNAAVLDSQYDAARDSMRLVFRPTSGEPRGVVLCAMGKSGREYRVFGDISGTFTAGPSGVIALPLPKDRTTQQVEIAPASGVK